MPDPSLVDRAERRRRIAEAGSFQAVLERPDGRELLEAEAADPDESRKLITRDQLAHLLTVREEQGRPGARLGLFFDTEDVIIVPGFLGSALTDATGGNGLIWVDPGLVLPGGGGQLSALRLGAFDGRPDRDATPGVRVEARGTIPAIYDLMRADLEVRRYSVQAFPFDWRKDIGRSADLLADLIRGRLGRKPRPLHIVAHSQGTLVARRAIQNLGPDQARRLVNNLVLLGPATFGTFTAAFAIAGNPASLETIRRLGVRVPADFTRVLQSFTGVYQLLPWDETRFANGFDPRAMSKPGFWETGVDEARLKFGFTWAERIDASFFNGRTAVVLGDVPTVGAVRFEGGALVADGPLVAGDGTVPDTLARLPGVRAFRARGAEHSVLPMQLSVLAAVRAILRGDAPAVGRDLRPALAAGAPDRGGDDPIPVLLDPEPPVRGPAPIPTAALTAAAATEPVTPEDRPPSRIEPPTPPCRNLRVFSFDPLLAARLDTQGIAEITIPVPWEPEGRLTEGPVGEYVEVIDYDPASRCFYVPVDLTLPRLAAQDGLPASESDPQFHQQMCYAVAMSTIATFEQALGRVALWAPRLVRDAEGEVIPEPPESMYVPRLRIYPHALREANAFYDPEKHALLFGYFPSREQAGGETLPGGTVFTCQSFDIVAHETTHALLHGLHRYYLYPSNLDLLAFHEAFADAVALFQHFSHAEVVRSQIARTRGDLKQENLLGQLALQFGRALGDHRGALRRYIDARPDPERIGSTREPHDRGAILMAALFLAFQNIYAQRSKDLYRIATGGTGRLPDGDIHPDLVNRLAVEAAKSARHVLNMCVRALDYVPPVDLTFGEYLRALITADYDLVRDDDRGYRVAVIDAFRSWGIYPTDVNVLDEAALLWRPPLSHERNALRGALDRLRFTDWTLRADRRTVFLQMEQGARELRRWLYANARESRDQQAQLGLLILGSRHHSIPRNRRGQPKFNVHSIRPCSRIGPDGQQRVDLVAEVVQHRAGYFDPAIQKEVDDAEAPWLFSEQDAGPGRPRRPPPKKPDFWFRGGCSLIIDRERGEIRYCVTKSVLAADRLAAQREFERAGALPSAAATYFGSDGRNPFALLHVLDD